MLFVLLRHFLIRFNYELTVKQRPRGRELEIETAKAAENVLLIACLLVIQTFVITPDDVNESVLYGDRTVE